MKNQKMKSPASWLLILLTFSALQCSQTRLTSDLIISGGTIYTMEKDHPTAEAMLIRGDRILFFGDSAAVRSWADTDAKYLDLNGAIAIPGLIDAHGHVEGLGKRLSQLDLVGTSSPEEIRQIVLKATTTTPEDIWVQGRGWDQNDWNNKQFPTRRELSETNSNPVYLRRIDGHACWVNSRAMEICGITSQTKDPAGGRIIRDSSGNPTGVFVDLAVGLITKFVDKPSFAQRSSWIAKGIKECNQLGLVGVHDAGVDSISLAIYRKLASEENLTLRINAMLSSEESNLLDSYLAKGPTVEAKGLVNIRSIKVYADGALGSRGAWLLQPYSDKPEESGYAINQPDKILELARRALKAGFQTCTHAIGDRAIRETLNSYQQALSEAGAPDARFRIEHSQIISEQDIPRFAKLGVIPAMQPTHATSDMYWAEERVGPKRITGAYAWRTLLESGLRIPFGSDFPVESANPLWGIYAAVTRQDHQNWPEGGWRPQEKLNVTEAVRGFTIDACYAEFAENKRGSLKIGKLADVTILSKDIFNIPPAEILETHTVYTIVGGKIIYSAIK